MQGGQTVLGGGKGLIETVLKEEAADCATSALESSRDCRFWMRSMTEPTLDRW